MGPLDLLLVNPNAKLEAYGKLSELSAIEPPFWCVLVAGFLRQQGFTVAILDAEAENLGAEGTAEMIVEQRPGLMDIAVLGINRGTSSTPKMPAVRQICQQVKKKAPDLKIILSGIHPSAVPIRTLDEEPCDYVVQGEGILTLWGLLSTLKQAGGDFTRYFSFPGLWFIHKDERRSVEAGLRPLLLDLDILPTPAWDLLDMRKYRCHIWQALHDVDSRSPYGTIYSSMGCPHNCNFCNCSALYSNKPGIRYRGPERVAQDLHELACEYGVRNFKIMDEIFVLNKERVLAVCKAISMLNYPDLNIWAHATVGSLDADICASLRAAGFTWISLDIKSACDMARAGVGKGYNDDRIYDAVELCHNAGIHVIGNFMFGLPTDNIKTMRETLKLAQGLNCEYANFYCNTAYPGSRLYEMKVRQQRPLPEFWFQYAQCSPDFQPLDTKHIKGQRVVEFRDEAFHTYFSSRRYQKMIEDTFGPQAKKHIQKVLK
jgi:anaerobic magnesium-protoporphyrin IX monomethyl ester cyclase